MRAEHRAGGGLWTLPEFRPFPAQVTTLSALPASRAGGGWTLLCPPSSTPPLPPPQGAWECLEGGREGMPEAQSTACACFPIWNSRSRLPLCSKAMETQGSPLLYVCAGKGEGGVQGTEGTPDIGLPADRPPSFLSRRFHYWSSPPPAASKEGGIGGCCRQSCRQQSGRKGQKGRKDRKDPLGLSDGGSVRVRACSAAGLGVAVSAHPVYSPRAGQTSASA